MSQFICYPKNNLENFAVTSKASDTKGGSKDQDTKGGSKAQDIKPAQSAQPAHVGKAQQTTRPSTTSAQPTSKPSAQQTTRPSTTSAQQTNRPSTTSAPPSRKVQNFENTNTNSVYIMLPKNSVLDNEINIYLPQ